uniref:Uncharacterized protein n=1 Tax=viral metagenome TaxID=1070528 RepID=A0A6M3IQE4_9ZZZZ
MYRPIYYYLWMGLEKIGTICLIPYKQDFARGVAICTAPDVFNKGIGKRYASERAYRGFRILVNAEKPPTEKQIRLSRTNKKYVGLEPIKRDGTHIQKIRIQLQELADDSKNIFKIETLPESGLSSYEHKLVERFNRLREKEKNNSY